MRTALIDVDRPAREDGLGTLCGSTCGGLVEFAPRSSRPLLPLQGRGRVHSVSCRK